MKKLLPLVLSIVLILNFAGCGISSTVEVVKCLYCGEKNSVDAKFCAYCGKAFVQTDGTSAADPSDTSSSLGGDENTHEASTNGEGATLPTEDLYVMQNSGADSVHYGNNVCIDGDMIYLGYYGSLYVFCGNEVATYAGGGASMASMAEIYLYNGYVYYANQSNHCIYRMSVADGEREIVLSSVGEIQSTFMRGHMLYITSVWDEVYDAGYSLNLDSLESNLLFRESDTIERAEFGDVYDDFAVIREIAGDTVRCFMLDTLKGTTEEIFSLTGSEEWRNIFTKNAEDYVYFSACDYDFDDGEWYFQMNKETGILEESSEEAYSAAINLSEDDGLEWQYYLAWGSNNLCREHKETGVQELLIRSGSGMREEGETVAKTYAINEIIYADDTHIIFDRSRMADGLERSIWMVDSDGNNLIELIRKEYHANEPEPYPTGSPSVSGGNLGSSTSSSDDPAVGTKTCALCEGDGRITCYYCKGSGKGPTIYVMGIPTEQGCTYCGSAGWRLCSGCGGKGVK